MVGFGDLLMGLGDDAQFADSRDIQQKRLDTATSLCYTGLVLGEADFLLLKLGDWRVGELNRFP